jgi:hypothetical protein
MMLYVEPEPNSGCWLWTGACLAGYGRFVWSGKVRRAHRVFYEVFRGEIPVDKELDHRCRVKSCVNPWHCEPVTHQQNVSRSVNFNRNKTLCRLGHPLTRKQDGRRFCGLCHRRHDENYRRRVIARSP